MILDDMWDRLAQHQPFADARGYGPEWAKMCAERTPDAAAAWAAAWAGDAAWAWKAAWAAWAAARGEARAAEAADAARDAAALRAVPAEDRLAEQSEYQLWGTINGSPGSRWPVEQVNPNEVWPVGTALYVRRGEK